MFKWLFKNGWKAVLLLYLANLVENIILLLFFNVPFSKQMIIGASVFALCVILIDRFLKLKILR